MHVVKWREKPNKSGTKKEEKENMKPGTAGMNVCQFCGYSHKNLSNSHRLDLK